MDWNFRRECACLRDAVSARLKRASFVLTGLLLLAGCASSPSPQPVYAPGQLAEVIAARLVADAEGQIDVRNGKKNDWMYKRVSRSDAHVTVGTLFLNPQTRQNVKMLRNHAGVKSVVGALAKQQLCASPLSKVAIDDGLKLTLDIVDVDGSTIMSTTVASC